VSFTSDKQKMGEFVNPVWLRVLAWAVAIIIGVLNAWLLFTTIRGWSGAGGGIGI
jgi:manganese transport protein